MSKQDVQHAHAHAEGDGKRIRIEHVTATTEIALAPEIVFDAFSGFARYDLWASEVQGAFHWLFVQTGGVSSRFLAYDKPGRRHLTHEGLVTEFERPRRFAWTAPFGEWPHALIGGEVDFQATPHGTRVQETVVFSCAPDDRCVLEAFLALDGFDVGTYTAFLRRCHAGVAKLLESDSLSAKERPYLFDTTRIVAADWPGRIATDQWVRILCADGELELRGPPSVIFNAFTRFARYRDWSTMIHVDQQ